MQNREPAVAGRFYPATAIELRHQLAGYFSHPPLETVVPKALIVPHAGYIYSGRTAAKAYRLLSNAESPFTRVVLLGPSHHVAFDGCAVPTSGTFMTPMGNVVIDKLAVDSLLAQKWVVESERAHLSEHSLEVQLPFLQYCLHDFSIVPVVVGQGQPEQISNILASLAKLPNTLIVVSSDLSHYHAYKEANDIDTITIDQMLAFDADIHPLQACGCNSINGLLSYAKQQQWQIQCVYRTNSEDARAHYEGRSPEAEEKVVGYASFVLY